MNDGDMYSGVDGIFENEAPVESTAQKLKDQEALIAELTPNLKNIIDMLDEEIASVMSVDRFVTATTQPEKDIRAELQASALYKELVGGLKNRFTSILRKTKDK